MNVERACETLNHRCGKIPGMQYLACSSLRMINNAGTNQFSCINDPSDTENRSMQDNVMLQPLVHVPYARSLCMYTSRFISTVRELKLIRMNRLT